MIMQETNELKIRRIIEGKSHYEFLLGGGKELLCAFLDECIIRIGRASCKKRTRGIEGERVGNRHKKDYCFRISNEENWEINK